MARRTHFPTAAALTVGLVASLALATFPLPRPVAEALSLLSSDVPGTPDLTGLAVGVADGSNATSSDFAGLLEATSSDFAGLLEATSSDVAGLLEATSSDVAGLHNTYGVAGWRRRGSTVERCERAGRRPVTKTAGPHRVVSRDQVARGGCRYFLQHGTLDMDELAVRLSISRATLYRVVHSRDQLLADVLWRLAENALGRARTSRTQSGVEGVLEVGRRFAAVLQEAKSFRTFLTSEPDVAARVLLTATGGVHHRAVRAQKEILAEATPPGQVWLTGDLDSLAYLLVRIFESTYYADLLASRQPDRDLAERAMRAVLAPSSVSAQHGPAVSVGPITSADVCASMCDACRRLGHHAGAPH